MQKSDKSLTPSKFINRKSIILALLEWRNEKHESSIKFLARQKEFKKFLIKKYKGHASKESLIFFAPMYEALKDNFDCRLGFQGIKELKLQKDNKKFVRYDFTIQDKKLIFEYDGLRFHTAENSALDREKTKLAEINGYTLIRLKGLKNTGDIETFNENQCIIAQVLRNYDIDISCVIWKSLKAERSAANTFTN